MQVVNSIPRPEYPRPQMVRDRWMNLNGEWEFEIDNGRSGKDRELFRKGRLDGRIIVPFCPESRLSGIGNTDFMNAVWYRREFEIPTGWEKGRVLIHFGAVDYDAEVWINGTSAGKHRGGYTSFSFDITGLLHSASNMVVVCAEDDVRSGLQPRGKQSGRYYSHACDYTRTTGIWQTVWLENVPDTYISSFRVIPDPDNACVYIKAFIEGLDGKFAESCRLEAEALYEGKAAGRCAAAVSGREAYLKLELSDIRLWEPGSPCLYDLKFSLSTGSVCVDEVSGYFGLRKVTWDRNAILINGKPVFQRLVLDQGFYPDGIYTAPDDSDLRKDIEIAMDLGFNGARMHQKVFEPRYIYWADRLGYMVWGEHASWGLDITTSKGLERFLPEWIEAMERDFNHPSIIGWCPFNETWDINGTRQDDEVLRITYNVTKSIDSTRPVIDTSGNYHVVTDIFDIHDYDQSPESLSAKLEPMKTGEDVYVTFPQRQKYDGQPYFVSEYGGIWWNPEQKDNTGWGYGSRPANEEEFLKRYEGLTSALLSNPRICAFCYTQLYDIEQEVNGLYTYDRRKKFDTGIIRKINMQKAAIE